MTKPTTHQRDLAKLPRALAPLIERPQWAVWRWTQKPDGSWQKPPYQATRSAATRQHQRLRARGPITLPPWPRCRPGMLTASPTFLPLMILLPPSISTTAATLDTHSIDIWAQLFLERGRDTYSRGDAKRRRLPHLGTGERRSTASQIHAGDRWQADRGRAVPAHQQSADDHRLSSSTTIRELTSIDKVLDWAVIWGERRKAAAAAAAAGQRLYLQRQRLRL